MCVVEYFDKHELQQLSMNVPFYPRLGGELGIVLHISSPLKREYAEVINTTQWNLVFF